MKWKSVAAAGLVAMGLGCGGVQEELAQGPEPVDAVQQGTTTTTTRTITFPARLPNRNCQFGNTALGHQAPRNSFASGRLEESITVTGLAGRRITSLQVRTPSAATASFKYDDVLTLNYKNYLLLASDRRVAGYSAGVAPDAINVSIIPYVWSNILNRSIANETAEPAWCVAGNTLCSVPRTETVGTLNVNVPDFKGYDELAYPTAPDSRVFTLVTAGDNDDGTFNSGFQTQDLDCTHGEIRLELIITSEPAPPPPPRSQYFNTDINTLNALHPGCTSAEFPANNWAGYSKACIAAAHRFCNNRGYESGVPSEILLPVVGVDCFRGQEFYPVHISELTALQPDCNTTALQSSIYYGRGCHAAASRYCRNRGFGSGLLQEILLPGMWVNCVPANATSYRTSLPATTWPSYHAGCDANNPGFDVTGTCRAAVRRYCDATHTGYAAGLFVEWGGAGSTEVACFLQ